MGAEAKIERAVVAWAEAHGILAIKFTPHGSCGWPDHLFIIPPLGVHVWVEFKAPGKGPTPLQIRRMDELASKGANVCWVTSYVAATDHLSTILDRGAHAYGDLEDAGHGPAGTVYALGIKLDS